MECYVMLHFSDIIYYYTVTVNNIQRHTITQDYVKNKNNERHF